MDSGEILSLLMCIPLAFYYFGLNNMTNIVICITCATYLYSKIVK